MMQLKLACVLVFSAVFVGMIECGGVKLPANIPLCKPGPDNCLPKTFTALLKSVEAIPGIDAPVIDPFVTTRITSFRTKNQNAPISMSIRNYNTTMYGMNQVEVLETKGWGADPGQSDFEIRFRVPRTNTIANYKATMKFFGLPISGQGVQNTTMKGVEVNLKLIANVVNRDGDDYLDLQKVNVDLKIKKMTVDIKDNLNDNLIMSTVNQVMNDNWREIFDEMKPDFEKFISETYKEVVKPVFDRVPYKNFFSE